MAPHAHHDWSDSDDDAPSGEQTSVLLGIPDGSVDDPSDTSDAAVSRIGGHPAFLPSREPPITSSYCKACENPMELLIQIWCPFEESPMDRALYIWGCPRVGCQKKQGCIRAWRGLRYNEKYAAKLKKKLAQKQLKSNASTQLDASKDAKSNPFAAAALKNVPAFGLGTQIFGKEEIGGPNNPSADRQEEQVDTDDGSESDTSEDSLLTAMTRASIDDTPWKSAPTYPPIYLSTVSEYLAPQPKIKSHSNVQVVDESTGDSSWMAEKYENSLDVDPVFARFTQRVAAEGGQCIRYELSGVPLPFASDEVYDILFPMPRRELVPVTKQDSKIVQPIKRTYDPSVVPRCEMCKSKRVFECQLMPNLINAVKRGEKVARKVTEEERRKEVAEALKGGKPEDKRGMEWGTCLVFSCSKDCHEETEVWREEVVYIQWDV